MVDRGQRVVFERTQQLKEWIRSVIPEICPERALLVTQSYKQTENEPIIMRRAKALRSVLENMSIWIHERELIVGNQASTPRSSPIFPETTGNWVEQELDSFWTRTVDKFKVRKEVKEKLNKEVFSYWRNKTIEAQAFEFVPEETKRAWKIEYPIFSPELYLRNAVGHLVPGYEIVLKEGYKGIVKKVKQKIDELDLAEPSSLNKKKFYEAVIIACEGAIIFAKRFSCLAAEMAKIEKDEKRKKELERIALICERVPAKPARNLHEALQSFWFEQLILQLEVDGLAISTERFDKLMYPFYKKDIGEGILTKEKAQELLECLWIKFFEIMKVYDLQNATYFSGYSIGQMLTIGGVDSNGRDDTNELSFLCVEVENNIRLTQPNLAVRINKNTPDEFLLRVCEHISVGTGKPSLFNDETIIPALLNRGIKLDEVRNYSLIGCVEASPPGCYYGWTNASMFNLAKCLELTLNNGKCRFTGTQIGPKTGESRKFKNFEELLSAYKKQVSYFVKHMIIAINCIDMTHQKLLPTPFLSAVMEDCIDKGLDVVEGGARYNFSGPQGVGVADVADSLAAIKKFVFEEAKLSMEELLSTLDSNFEDNPKLRYLLSEKAPKYGNDDDYVDSIAVEIARQYCQEVEKYKNARGGYFHPGLYPVSANVPMGMNVAALPSGRLDREPLADGISPAIGGDRNGPTSVVKSVSKLDHVIASNGTLLNQKFNPEALSTKAQLINFMNLIRVYFELGGWHIQCNVISAKTLREAQRNPEQYRNLLVRVAGYSAFFVDLDRSLQENIIARTEHASI
jgi:formate C-acetyltransferase